MQESKRRPRPVHVHGWALSGKCVCGAKSSDYDPYVEASDANPERRDNGCMIYRGAE